MKAAAHDNGAASRAAHPSRLHVERMAALVQAQRLLAGIEATTDELIARIPDLALTVVQASSAVFEVPEGETMVCRTASATAAQMVGLRVGRRGSLAGETLRLNCTLRCDDARTDTRVDADSCRRLGVRSLVATVVRDKSGPIGVIKLMDHRPAHFGAAEADSLELLAEALGAVLQRKRAEADAQRAIRIQAGIVQTQQQIAAADADPQASMDLMVERAQSLSGADGASIALVEGEYMVYRAVCGLAAERLGRGIRRDGSLGGLAVEREQILRCDDSESDPRVNIVACREMGIRSVMIAPLRVGDTVVGALRVMARRTHAFTQLDGATLQILAESLGVVMHRQAAAEQLQTSEAQYRKLFAAHPLPMWVYDIETLYFLAVNDAAIAQYGYAQAEFLAMTIRDIRPAAAARALDAFLAGLGQAPQSAVLSEHRKKDGTLIAVEVSANTIHFGGRPARLVLANDITARKRADEKLRKNEALLSIAGRAARIGGWSVDFGDGERFGWSDELCALLDMPAGSVRTVAQALDFCAPESRALMRAAAHRCSSDGMPYDIELEMITARGHRICVRAIGQPVRDGAGAIVGAEGAVQDISEKKLAEEEARTLSANLATQLESITDAFFTLDRDWRFTYVNSETQRLTRRSRADLMGLVVWEVFPDAIGGDFDRRCRDAVEHNRAVAFETHYAPWQQWFEVRAYPSPVGLTVYFRDVTQRHREQEQLVLLQTCLASMKDMVIITEVNPSDAADLRIVFVNDAFVRFTGYSREEALGRSRRLLHGPKTQPQELERIATALQRCEPVRAEVINYTKAGKEYWVELEIVPVWSAAGRATHFIGVHRDTTERRLVQEALRSLNENLEAKVAERTLELELTNGELASREEKMRSVVEHMADGVLTFSDEGVVHSANSKVEAIFGHAPSALIGSNVSVLIPALGVAALAEAGGEPGIEGAIARIGREVDGRHQNGDRIVLEVAISRYRIKGQRVWTAIVRDIGERVRIMAALEHARRGAEQASRAKSAFVATMSHEIRTPMNGVIGMIDVLNQTELTPEQSKMLDLASESALSLMGIIEDILDFSKIEAGKVELERMPFSVADVVAKSCALVSGVAAAKGVELATRLDPALPVGVWGDAGRLRQALVNLLANAIKFTSGRRAGAKVSIAATLSGRSAEGVMVELAVEDNGIGMDAATIGRLFTPFSQADASTTRRFGGTGLGLTISKDLIGLMGGTIRVRSTPGVGSIFTICLPLLPAPIPVSALPPAAADRRARDAMPIPQSADGVRRHGKAPRRRELVLVAEDNAINQQVILQQLDLLGYRAEIAADGREALVLWRSGRFAVLLTDLQMPEMDGYGLAAAVRSEEGAGLRTPIVALTANALKEEARRCTSVGMDDYLTKPVPLSTLDATLQRWLGSAGSPATSAAKPVAVTPPGSDRGAPIDATVLPALIGDDRAALNEFLIDFVASATEAAAELAAAAAGSECARAGAVAHRLKASARAIGALHLGDLCAAIEHAAEAAERVAFAPLLESFDAELARVRAWVAACSTGERAAEPEGVGIE